MTSHHPNSPSSQRPLPPQNNITLTWQYDENATSICTLQGPGSTVAVLCGDHTFQEDELTEGYHTLYIQASDREGNSHQYQHQWFVDLTKPITYFSHAPNNYSSGKDFTFTFYCHDSTSCTYKCKHNTAAYEDCQTSYSLKNLAEGNHTVSVYAIDGVGNIGSPVSHIWHVDNQPPTLSSVSNVTVSCGDPHHPHRPRFPHRHRPSGPQPQGDTLRCSRQSVPYIP